VHRRQEVRRVVPGGLAGEASVGAFRRVPADDARRLAELSTRLRVVVELRLELLPAGSEFRGHVVAGEAALETGEVLDGLGDEVAAGGGGLVDRERGGVGV